MRGDRRHGFRGPQAGGDAGGQGRGACRGVRHRAQAGRRGRGSANHVDAWGLDQSRGCGKGVRGACFPLHTFHLPVLPKLATVCPYIAIYSSCEGRITSAHTRLPDCLLILWSTVYPFQSLIPIPDIHAVRPTDTFLLLVPRAPIACGTSRRWSGRTTTWRCTTR